MSSKRSKAVANQSLKCFLVAPPVAHASRKNSINGLNIKRVRIYFRILFSLFFRFSSGPATCRILQHFLKIDVFYTSPSTSPALFSTSPACPTNIPSITNKCWRVDGVEKMMIQIGGHFTRCNANLKSSRGGSPPNDVRESDDSTRGAIQSL